MSRRLTRHFPQRGAIEFAPGESLLFPRHRLTPSFRAGGFVVIVVIVVLFGVVLPFLFDFFWSGVTFDEHAQVSALPPNVQRARRFALVQYFQTFVLPFEIVMDFSAVAL